MNITTLKTELAKPLYSGLNATQAAANLNAPTLPFYVEVATPELTNFLMNAGLYSKLLAVYRDHPSQTVRVVAEGALDLAQSQIPFVNVQNETIQRTLPALVSGGVWTQAEADSVINFAKRFRSRAVELLGQDVTEQDVRAARLYDRAQAEQSELDAMREAVSLKEYRLAQLRAGVDPDTEGGA